MDQWAFFDELKAGTVRNVYCFYGPEAYIRRSAVAKLREKVLMPGLEDMNETVLSAPTAQQIIESCETLPMMSDYRLIIVRDCALTQNGKAKDEAQESAALCEYLPRVPETTCLLFDLGDGVDKRKKLAQALMKLPGAVGFDALLVDFVLCLEYGFAFFGLAGLDRFVNDAGGLGLGRADLFFRNALAIQESDDYAYCETHDTGDDRYDDVAHVCWCVLLFTNFGRRHKTKTKPQICGAVSQ